ncbi:MAG TPA: lipopolysaccharide biosynthesis protein [Methylomirabilota bacterium]
MTTLEGREPATAAFKATVARGAATVTVAQWLGLLVNLLSTVVLARLLAPADYGLVAMATAVVGLAWLLQDLGLSQATIQAAELDDGKLTALFWIGTAFGALVALGLAVGAGAVAGFYDEPRVARLTIALSATCLLAGLGAQHRALLVRELRFTAVALIGLLASLAGLLVGVTAAMAGAGHWALVAMYLVNAACAAGGCWIAHSWRPSWPRRGAGIRPMLRFGGALTAGNVLNYVARNLDNILIGRVWGPEPLGLYSRAYALMMLPLNQFNAPVSSVAIPALSRVQNDPARFRAVFLQALSAVAFCGIPLFLAVAVLSRDIVEILFGERWLEAAPIVTVLALAGAVQPLTHATGWVYVALGRAARMARWAGVSTGVLALSFVGGLPWGPLGVAIGYAVGVYALAFPAIVAACHESPISPLMFVRAAARPVLLGVSFAGGAAATRLLVTPGIPAPHGLAVSVLGGGIACLALVAASPTIRLEIASLLRLVRLAAGSSASMARAPEGTS